VIEIRRYLVSILEICFSTLQLHASNNTSQTHAASRQGYLAPDAVLRHCLEVPKGWLHGDIEILGTSTPCGVWRYGGGACVEHFHPPSSTFRQPSRLAASHTHGEGSLHPWASYHTLSLSVEKLKYGRCSSGASGLAAPLTCELCIQRLLPSAYFRSNLTAPGAPLANAGVRNKARLHITVARPIVGHPHI
jgi:hypothetical protein